MDTILLPISDCCRFHLGDELDAWQAWFDDSDWQEVTLPHDWSVTLPFSRDCSSGTGYLPGGIGWYRIHISPKDEWKNHEISICFDGVYKNSRVWCNSYYLGERPNGYISFSYNITEQFRFDADNIITVYVDHRETADSRWYTGSGITRNVSLLIEDMVHPAQNGIFFSTSKVTETEASYNIKNEIINHKQETCNITVTNLLFNEKGELASESRYQTTIAAMQSKTLETTGIIKNPLLWSPETPNLYTLKTYIAYGNKNGNPTSKGMIKAGAGLVSTQKVGIRSFYFHPDKGLFLNDKSYLLKGVCIHHDAGCLGAAVLPAVWHRRLMKLKEMGCNAIRMSHNPHMPELYDLCDSLGFLVIDEAFDEWEYPKNKWHNGENVSTPKYEGYYTNFPTWHEQDLTEMVRRDRNHPSVIMWSIGNAPTHPNTTRLTSLTKQLCNIVKKTDSTRPITLAASFPEVSSIHEIGDALDVIGFNYNEHLYEDYHVAHPDKPLFNSETSHAYKQWETILEHPCISGQFLWTGIDYLGEATSWPIHGSNAGLLTLAGFEKTEYYRRQSFWSHKPMIHIATIREAECNVHAQNFEFSPVSECWDYIPGESIVVKCYTNLQEVEFFLNNKSLGVYKKATDKDCIFITIPFTPGELRVVGKMASVIDKRVISHSLFSSGSACQLKLEAHPFVKNNLKQVEVTICDFKGNRVYHDSTLLHITIENGKLLGLENGDISDTTDYSSSHRRAFHGQLLIYAIPFDKNKKIKITVQGEHIKTEHIIL